jgi:hypothetical protein
VRGVTGIFRKGEESPMNNVVAAGVSAVDDLKSKLDGAVKQAVEAIGGPGALSTEIERLHTRLTELEKKLEQLVKP